MASFRFLHCADLHIDSPLRGLEADAPAAKIRNATRDAFTNLVTYAIEHHVDFVVAAGDLYDGAWEDWRTGQFLIGEIGRLHREGIPFIAISGNHDAHSIITRRLRFPDTARMMRHDGPDTHEIRHLDVVIHGQSFATRDVREDISRSYPERVPGKFNIGLLHTNMDGNPGHDPYAPSRSEHLIGHDYQYWALGHIHARKLGPPQQNVWLVYPGNLQGRHIGETGAKGAVLVTVKDGAIIDDPEFIPFDTVRFELVRVDIGSTNDLDDVLTVIRSKLERALADAEGRLLAARIVLTGASAAYAELIRDANETRERIKADAQNLAGSDALWIEDVRLCVAPPTDAEPLPHALAAALEAEPPSALHANAQKYAKDLLDRVGGLSAALGNEHLVVKMVADGQIPAELLDRAHALLRARAIRPATDG